MKVNGEAFRQAREEIRKNAGIPKGVRGEPAEGTQEWLAEKSLIKSRNGGMKCLSVRTIQALERGEASIQTVDAVSPHLGLNGRELIIGYGRNSVTVEASGVVDLRSMEAPLLKPDNFHTSPLMLTLDPLVITISDDELETVELRGMSAMLLLEKQHYPFKWLYEVALVPNGNGWLGNEGEVAPETLRTPASWKKSIMFTQTEWPALNWSEFVNAVESTDRNLLQLEVNIEFRNFRKTLNIGLAVAQMRSYLDYGRQVRQAEWPSRIQPDALVWQ